MLLFRTECHRGWCKLNYAIITIFMRPSSEGLFLTVRIFIVECCYKCYNSNNMKILLKNKNWKKECVTYETNITPVSKGEVGEFLSKLNDLNNISGMMVAKSGYQEGAKQFAESNGIHLMETKDLPSLGEIVAGVIKEAFLPDEATQGAPFWTLMEIQSGEITGTYFSLPEGKPIVPFFYSKVIAEKMREKLLDAENWVVRGVSQYQLKGFVAQMEVLGVEAAVFYVPYWKEGETDVPMVIIPKEKLKEEYIY